MNMRKLLVTGGAGFIGSNFVRMILSEQPDCFVVNLDKLTYAGNLENLAGFENHKNHKFIKGDICDAKLIERIIDEFKIDSIVNFAAESHVDRSISEPKIFIETNVTGTLTILEAARDKKLRQFVQISTDEVYGALGRKECLQRIRRLAPTRRIRPARHQRTFSSAHSGIHSASNTISLAARTTTDLINSPKLIPLMINNALNDKQLPIYGDGMQIRDWLYVYDHCTAIWKVLTEAAPGEIYNIGGCNEKANIDVVRLILGRLGKPESLIKHVTDRPGHDRRYAIDASKIINKLNWKPSVSFEQGIVKTIDWYLANRNWLANVVSGDYQKYYDSMYKNR